MHLTSPHLTSPQTLTTDWFWVKTSCCASRSIPNYIAQFGNKTTCEEIVQEDVDAFRAHLATCADAFHSDRLTSCEMDDDDERASCMANPSVPVECWKDNAAYDVFNALADRDYINPAEQVRRGFIVDVSF